MKILVAGNSQAGALHGALKEGLLADETVIRPDFYVVPGGDGPRFELRERKLVVTSFNEKYQPYMIPAGVRFRRVDEYDVIVVSALGYVDGGFLYHNLIPRQGYVAEYLPREDRPDRPLISRACFADIVRSALMQQPGFVFLKMLCAEFSDRVLVQPFPYSSACLADREDWESRRYYHDFLGFNRFLFGLRDDALRDICADAGAGLLGPPDPSWSLDAFTPRDLMKEDGLHPLPPYGAMVLRQITEHLIGAKPHGQGS